MVFVLKICPPRCARTSETASREEKGVPIVPSAGFIYKEPTSHTGFLSDAMLACVHPYSEAALPRREAGC